MKMSLLDFPGYVAATVFLGGCDMRCPFCHNFELTDYNAPAIWEEADLFKFLDTLFFRASQCKRSVYGVFCILRKIKEKM